MDTKKKITFLILCVILFSGIATVILPNVRADITNTITVLSPSSDGYAYAVSTSSYSEAWAATTATAIVDSGSGSIIMVGGQYYETDPYGDPYYHVFRVFTFFDTSPIPDGATINSVILSLYVASDESDTDFNVTVQSSTNYPHDPIQSGDYYKGWYSSSGGSRSTSEISGTGYWNITFDSTGIGYVSKTGTTRLCLRSSRDISGSAPSGFEYVTFKSRDSGEAYAPKLYVTYTVSEGGGEPEPGAGAVTYIVHGPFNEDGTVYNGYVTVKLHKPYEVLASYVLDGTGGVEDNETIVLDQHASFFSWNLTSYNYSRSYYLLGDSFEELWVFIPSTEEPAYNYLFTITDFYGMIDPYLQTTINVEGVQRIVERRSLATTDSVTFLLTQWHRYGLTFVCDQGTYSKEFLAESVFSNNLVVLAGAFPVANVSIGIAATAVRTSDSTITVTYADSNEMTISLYMEISHRSGGTDILDYSSTTTGSSQTLTWTDAVAEWDYDVYLEAYRSDNTYIWNLPVPSLSTSSNPFGGLISALGTFPTGFNADQIPAAIIIVGVLAIFSVYSSTAGIALSIIVAGVLGVLGFFVISATNLVFAGFVAIMAHIGESKKTEREV